MLIRNSEKIADKCLFSIVRPRKKSGTIVDNNEDGFRCANRNNVLPDNRFNDVGFRVVCSAQL